MEVVSMEIVDSCHRNNSATLSLAQLLPSLPSLLGGGVREGGLLLVLLVCTTLATYNLILQYSFSVGWYLGVLARLG